MLKCWLGCLIRKIRKLKIVSKKKEIKKLKIAKKKEIKKLKKLMTFAFFAEMLTWMSNLKKWTSCQNITMDMS